MAFLLVAPPFIAASGFQTPGVSGLSSGQGANVNLYTGQFTFGIPLVQIPTRSFNYPLTLGYASGIKMNQQASWVGLGWDLSPGAITRMPRGMPDDWNNFRYYEWNEGGGLSGGLSMFGVSISFSPNGFNIAFSPIGFIMSLSGNPISIFQPGFSNIPTGLDSDTGGDLTQVFGFNYIQGQTMVLENIAQENGLCRMPGPQQPNRVLDVVPDLYSVTSSLGLSGAMSPYRPSTSIECSRQCSADISTCDGCLNRGTCLGNSAYYFLNMPKDLRKIEHKKEAARLLLTELNKIPDKVEQAYYLEKLGNILGVSEQILRESMPREKLYKNEDYFEEKSRFSITDKSRPVLLAETFLLINPFLLNILPTVLAEVFNPFPFKSVCILYLDQAGYCFFNYAIDYIEPFMLPEPMFGEIYKNLILSYNKAVDSGSLESVVDNISKDDKTKNYINSLYFLAERDFDGFEEEAIKEEVVKSAKALKTNYIFSQRKRLEAEMRKAEEKGDQETMKKLMSEFDQSVALE